MNPGTLMVNATPVAQKAFDAWTVRLISRADMARAAEQIERLCSDAAEFNDDAQAERAWGVAFAVAGMAMARGWW